MIHPLVEKCMVVVMSCETADQLDIAINYCNLVYRKLSKTAGLVNLSGYSMYINQAIGWALCKIEEGKS